jgi:hypothetical protein
VNFRIRSVVAIVLAVGLCVSGLAAPSAHAAPKPKLTTAKVTTTFDTSVGSYTYTYVKPKLSGVKSSVKKKVEKEINAFFASAISLQKTFVDDDLLCVPEYDPKNATLSGKLSGGIYKSRYLSVHLTVSGPGCGDGFWLLATEAWVNIDLKTGKAVKLSTFVDNRKNVFFLEVGRAIAKKSADGWPPLGAPGRETLSSWKRGHAGWTVNSKGVKLYYYEEHSGTSAYQVKWERILKPGQVSGKKKYTSNASYSCSDDSKRKKVTVQGNLVTVKTPWETFYGVRGKSKKVVVWSKNYAPNGGGLSQVTFASATSKTAKKFTQLNYC